MWYYAITTLTTIGYGDFHPISTSERVITSFVLLFGVSVFSYIMGNFIDILMHYRNQEGTREGVHLSRWLALLARFNNGMPLKKELVAEIEDFFEYYWKHDKLQAISSKEELRFMS